MPIPATTGQFRTKLEDMQVGDYIAFKAVGTSGVPCTISDMGAPLATAQANEIPITGSASPNGYAYAIKADKGLCISDRPVQHSVSWDALNSAKLIQGKSSLRGVTTIPLNDIGLTLHSDNWSIEWEELASSYPLYSTFINFNSPILTNAGMMCSYYDSSRFGDQMVMYASSNGSTWDLGGGLPFGTAYINTWTRRKLTKVDEVLYIYENGSLYKTYNFANLLWAGITTLLFGRDDAYTNGLKIYKNVDSLQTVIYSSTATLIRSLTGGNAYLGTDGKYSLTDKGLGAFPANEWDKYIVGSNLGGKITAGDDNVWHWNVYSLMQDTPSNNVISKGGSLASSSNRVIRGYNDGINGCARLDLVPSVLGNDTNGGFRPVFQFLEPNSKATNLFY